MLPLKYLLPLVAAISTLASAATPTIHNIEIHFYYRDSTIAGKVTTEEEIVYSIPVTSYPPGTPIAEIGREPERLVLGDFQIYILGMANSLDIRFVDKEGERAVAALKYQMTDKLANQFGGHGFTGLNYIYNPDTEAEIQCWATVEE